MEKTTEEDHIIILLNKDHANTRQGTLSVNFTLTGRHFITVLAKWANYLCYRATRHFALFSKPSKSCEIWTFREGYIEWITRLGRTSWKSWDLN
jgi:hypothetical protein